jgi:hypothetical protein
MHKPLFIVFSLLLTAAIVAWVGWPALLAIAALSLCTIFFSSGPPHSQPVEDDARDLDGRRVLPAATAGKINSEAGRIPVIVSKLSIDDGWYYPVTDASLLAAANSTTFDELQAAERQVQALRAIRS